MDPRIQTITEATVYGLFHNDALLYVGATTQPLRRRLQGHKKSARTGHKTAHVYEYIRDHVNDLDDDLSIREIGYETEQEALDALGEDTLNEHLSASETSYQGYDWTPEEVDVLEEAESINKVSKQLDASYNACRRAAIKLGLIDGSRAHTAVDWDEWDHLLGTMPDAKLAERIGCTQRNVQRRRQQLGIDACGRLSDEKVAEIYLRYRLDEEASYADLAEEYEVSKYVIGQIVRGETYRHVDREALDRKVEEVEAMIEKTGKTANFAVS